jgi:hypothetical protein
MGWDGGRPGTGGFRPFRVSSPVPRCHPTLSYRKGTSAEPRGGWEAIAEQVDVGTERLRTGGTLQLVKLVVELLLGMKLYVEILIAKSC